MLKFAWGDFMKHTRILLAFLLICVAFSIIVFSLFVGEWFFAIDYVGILNGTEYALLHYSILLLFCLFVFSMCVLQLILILRKTNFVNYTRLTYEQYKEKRQEKQAEKKQAKIEKLKNQIEEIEKD